MEAEGEEDAPAGTAEAMAPVAAGCDEELARRLQEQEEQALEESRRQQQAEDARLAQALEFDELEPTGSKGSQVVPRGMLISPAVSSTEAAAASRAPAASAQNSEANDIKLLIKSALSIGFTRFSSMSCFLGVLLRMYSMFSHSPAGARARGCVGWGAGLGHRPRHHLQLRGHLAAGALRDHRQRPR